MSASNCLNDFPKQTANYLNKLSKNNNRKWFEANRAIYNSDFLEPAIQFVVEMGEKLLILDPELVAMPKIDKSIFRLHRDVRFSKNKDPYKTNAGLYFWNGKAKKMESSGFYFHLEPKKYGLGVGMHIFPKQIIKSYRDAVADPTKGKELDQIVKRLLKKGCDVGGKNYKRIPRGYDVNSPYAEYLLHDGVFAWYEGKSLIELSGSDVIYKVFKIFKDMLPLHQWFVKYVL
jgi:uncharacterized protein (TIGR02453 family)